MTQLHTDVLITRLREHDLHALACKAEQHTFAAENEERMQAMSAAGSQITRDLDAMEASLRQVRQEAVTIGIIELGTGAATARTAR